MERSLASHMRHIWVSRKKLHLKYPKIQSINVFHILQYSSIFFTVRWRPPFWIDYIAKNKPIHCSPPPSLCILVSISFDSWVWRSLNNQTRSSCKLWYESRLFLHLKCHRLAHFLPLVLSCWRSIREGNSTTTRDPRMTVSQPTPVCDDHINARKWAMNHYYPNLSKCKLGCMCRLTPHTSKITFFPNANAIMPMPNRSKISTILRQLCQVIVYQIGPIGPLYRWVSLEMSSQKSSKTSSKAPQNYILQYDWDPTPVE